MPEGTVRARRAGTPAPLCCGLALVALVAVLTTVPGARAQDLPTVTLATSDRDEIVEELPLNGELSARRRAHLSTDVTGRVETIEAEEGDRVATGEVLLSLDKELARLDLEQARAARDEAVSDFEDAERRLREARALAERQSIAQTDVRAREFAVERQRATLARRDTEVDRSALLLERHDVRAPFNGVITERTADPGEWIEPGTTVYELVAVDRLRLDLMAPQRYFGRIDPNTRVRIRIDALGDETLTARIDEVVPDSAPESRSFPVRVRLDNSDLRLTPGMSARATLELGTGREGVLVPRDALIRYSDGRTVVFTAAGEGEQRTVTERRIETGSSFAGRIEVTAGLEAGTPVVLRGNEALRDGQSVRVIERR